MEQHGLYLEITTNDEGKNVKGGEAYFNLTSF